MKRSKKILIYKLGCVIFALILLCLPQRSFPNSNIRVLATVMGIDGGEGNVSVSAQLAIPVAQGGDGKASTVAKATGGSLGEALENLEIGLGRRIDYGHLSTVAIGKDMGLKDLKEFIGYLLSSDKMGPGAYLVYCSKTSAENFIDEAQNMGESSDAELSNFISYNKSDNHVTTATALRFLQTLHSSSGAAILPCVQLEDEGADSDAGASGRTNASGSNGSGGEENSGGDGNKNSGEENSGDSEGNGGENGSSSNEQNADKKGGGKEGSGGGSKKKLVAVDSVAVYGGDSDSPAVLDKLVTRGIVWQDLYSDFGLIELRNVELDGNTVNSITARLSGKTVKKKARVVNGENVFTYKIKLKLKIDDANICANPRFYSHMKNALEKEFESVVKNNLMLAVKASKEMNTDFLEIREWYRKFCRKGFENFDLNSVVVEVVPKVTIKT